MEFSILPFTITIIPTVISFLILLAIKDKTLRILCCVVCVAFYFYSGLGLALYTINGANVFIIQYDLSILAFSITVYLYQGRCNRDIRVKQDIDEPVFRLNNCLIIKVMTCIYIFTFLFPFFYPSLSIDKLFNPSSLWTNYYAVTSTQRLALSQDSIYQLVCSTIRTLCLPAFYIFFYQQREKPLTVISLYTLVTYCSAINMNYISRNELAVFLVFIYVYLYKEQVISRRALRLIGFIAIPTVMLAFASLFYIRLGISVDDVSPGKLIESFLTQETNFVKNFPKASELSESVSGLMFFIYVLTCFIPLSIRAFFGVKEVALSQILSNNILNMHYGDQNYYLLLPSVLGEGIMVFNHYLAWLYLIFFALILCWFYKRIRRNHSMDYLMIYFIIDVIRQMRGGSQFIISTWMAALVPFLIVCYVIRQMVSNKGKRNRRALR